MEMSLWKSLANLDRAANRMGSVFDDVPEPWGSAHGGAILPAADMHEDAMTYTLSMDVPGIDASELHVEVDGQILTVRGERKLEKAEEREGYRAIERRYGSFRRSFTLPNNVDISKAKAKRKNGVLMLTMPKTGGETVREIPVN